MERRAAPRAARASRRAWSARSFTPQENCPEPVPSGTCDGVVAPIDGVGGDRPTVQAPRQRHEGQGARDGGLGSGPDRWRFLTLPLLGGSIPADPASQLFLCRHARSIAGGDGGRASFWAHGATSTAWGIFAS